VGQVSEVSEEARSGEEPAFDLVDRLEFAGRVHFPWQEAVEKAVTLDALDPKSESCTTLNFSFPAGRTVEYLRDESGQAAGAIVREWNALDGSVELQSTGCPGGVIKIAVTVRNLTGSDSAAQASRDSVLLDSLVSAHTLLGVENGEFLSLLEPPPGREDLIAHCTNIGTWPVLVGDGANIMLSSPIILYDHPQIAPESAGNLFDSTEIDEILSLRILTLTDEEKREMRQSDDRARGILERTENMPEEQFMKLHGVLRGLNVLKEETQ
jgi:hydrogenase maturation protease